MPFITNIVSLNPAQASRYNWDIIESGVKHHKTN
jgi:hypothetical protein